MGKLHLTRGHDGPQEEQRYGSTFALTSALEWGVGGQRHLPAVLPTVQRLGGPQGPV